MTEQGLKLAKTLTTKDLSHIYLDVAKNRAFHHFALERLKEVEMNTQQNNILTAKTNLTIPVKDPCPFSPHPLPPEFHWHFDQPTFNGKVFHSTTHPEIPEVNPKLILEFRGGFCHHPHWHSEGPQRGEGWGLVVKILLAKVDKANISSIMDWLCGHL